MTQTFEHPRQSAHDSSFSAFVDAFSERRHALGYSPASMKASVGLVKDFAAWLERHKGEGIDIAADHVAEYLNERWLQRRRRRGDAHTLREFISLHKGEGPVSQAELPASTTAAHRVRQEFEQYLRLERGLAQASIRYRESSWRRARPGRRDHALMLLAVQTGLRLSELTALRRDDVQLGTGAHVRVIGKGRKERVTPLSKVTADALQALRCEIGADQDLVFSSTRGTRLSADAVQHLVSKHVARASQSCPSLRDKHVTPHVLRHSAAMELLQAGVDRTVIAMWLGHESIETTQIYLDANLQIKQAALDKLEPLAGRTGRFRPDDQLLAFLQSL